jgi:PIN domain nuclease of toxin-antitoxin system
VILLDTHAAVWLASDDPALGKKSCSMALAARTENQLAISAISFWEVALLVAKNRLELRRRPAELRAELLDTGVIEFSLTGDIALLAVELKNLHGDPADRFIAATAIAHDAKAKSANSGQNANSKSGPEAEEKVKENVEKTAEDMPRKPAPKSEAIGQRDQFDAMRLAMPDLVRLERYERRAWSRRKRAINSFMEIKARES